LVTLEKERQKAVDELANLGIVHISELTPPQATQIEEKEKELNLINSVIQILEKINANSVSFKKFTFSFSLWQKIAQHIIDLDRRIFQLEEYRQKLLLQLEEYKDWGDFDIGEIAKLEPHQIYVKFYLIPKKELRSIPKDFFVKPIFFKNNFCGCVVIGYKKIPQLTFKEIKFSKLSILQIKKRLEEDQKLKEILKEELFSFLSLKEDFLKIKKTLEEELLILKTVFGMERVGVLVYLVGFVPYDKVDLIENLAKKNNWAYLTVDPKKDEPVPTLIKVPKFLEIIQPVFRFLELVPGYDEQDISLWFLIFFSIFFGIIIGDAGYGLVYFFLTLLFETKFGKRVKDKNIFGLFYLLSLSAIILGLFSGTFFGQNLFNLKPLFSFFKNDLNIQKLCFLLGAIHLSIAHLYKAIIKFPELEFLSQIGWLIIVWASFYLAKSLVLGEMWVSFIKWLYLGGAILIIFFTSPSKNLIKSIFSGLGSVLSNLTGTFTDLVSYIRLFAVGLASIAVADTFNQMAIQIGFGNFLRSLIASLVLICGHFLNILLGPMSVLVHGVRLNVLEFCNHLDIKWKGFFYKPLKKS
ncbi:MAG: hypothetical protein NC935_04175, partial [Candidatus Omnitrophica bacterium]|nr:hypothetical protein [Candidatus Omnitrophota bacterium]